MKSNLVDLDLILVRDHPGDKAILVRRDEDASAVWLPRSAIEVGDSNTRNCVTVTLPEALAQEKGLI